MTLSELIAHVGDDNVTFQNLDANTVACEINGSVGTFTFNTDPKHVKDRMLGKPECIAFVVWLPTDLLPESAWNHETENA